MNKINESESPLSIAILGAGKIGSTFAFQLARAGHHEVTVISRPGSERLKQLQHDNGIINIKGEKANVQVTDVLDEQAAYDLVIVTTLDYQVDAVLPALQRSAAKSIQFMFVTFDPDRLGNAVGADRCSFGMPYVQSIFDQNGRLKTTIGAGGQKTMMSNQRWVDVFSASGLPAAFEPDMALWLRCQVPLCTAFESVSVAAQKRAGGASWSEAMTAARGMHEGFALIKGLGYQVYPKSKVRLNRIPNSVVALMFWMFTRIKSMRELLATGERECRALVDVMLAVAPKANPPVQLSKIQAMKPYHDLAKEHDAGYAIGHGPGPGNPDGHRHVL